MASLRALLRLLVLGLALAALAVGTAASPVSAQGRSSLASRRARARAARARRGRAHRATVRRRRARRQSVRRSISTIRPTPPAPEDDARVDMDFVDPMENETPPPMDTSYVDEQARRTERERVAALDPELFGDAREREPGAPREPGRFSPLTLRLNAGALDRGFTLRGYERGPISDYLLPVGSMVGLGLDYYPGAHVFNDALAHLGVQFDLHHSIYIESQGANETSYQTTALSWQLGLRYRGTLDDAGSEISPELSGGQQSFVVERGSLERPAPDGAPNVAYTFVRAGGLARAAVGDAWLGIHAAYLLTFDVGRIGRELGGASAHGAELGLSFAYRLGLGFALTVDLHGRLYVVSATPNDTAPSSARGAFDHYAQLDVGVEWRMPAEREIHF